MSSTTEKIQFNRIDSLASFKGQALGSSSAILHSHMEKIVKSAGDKQEEVANNVAGFTNLFAKFARSSPNRNLDWSKIEPPPPGMIQLYSELKEIPEEKIFDLLDKLVVLKLNGGLGTTMGCKGPKSAIEVRDERTFLDITVRQIEWLNESFGCNVPLLLMNSFNTHDETERIVRKYTHSSVEILTFNQSRFPRIYKETLTPISEDWNSDNKNWYPPGHGDVYRALYNSGFLDGLIEVKGKEYLFMSNIDNLGATVDLKILQSFADNSECEYIMEVTDKTMADVKGGTLISYDGSIRLLEIAQVAKEHVDEFKSIKKFRIFNTNNIWMKLKAIRRLLSENENGLDLEVLVNNKTLDGNKIIQLETAVGAGIRHFNGSMGINVPRTRFLPVKTCSDLLLLKSNLYSLSHGELVINPERPVSTSPLVKLGDDFKHVSDFMTRFKTMPDIKELMHLTVSGDVNFGRHVVLKGTVIIIAEKGNHIDIPSNSILENKIVSGNLRILEH